jgi:hypothetical protein
MKKSICKFCNEEYLLGYTGTIEGCDICLENVRDSYGYVYELHKDEITLMDVKTGRVTVRNRPQTKE